MVNNAFFPSERISFMTDTLLLAASSPNLGWIGWIIIGGLAGWIGSKIIGTDASMGILLNIIVGIIGGFLGGWLLGMLGALLATRKVSQTDPMIALGGNA